MKNPSILFKRLIALIGFLLFAIPLYAQTQLPECEADVPFFDIDLSGSPDTSFTTPQVERNGACCASTNSDLYLSFYVDLHPQVAMVEIVVAPGYADPGGSGSYHIISGGDLTTPGDCGTAIAGGDPVCISGTGPYKITYSKPGKNNIKYIFRQIPRPTYPPDGHTRLGCSLPLPIYGLDNIEIHSINSSEGITTPDHYNSLLTCVNCSTPSFTPGLTTPYWIDYQICGSPQASLCGYYPPCDTVRVYTHSTLDVSTFPDPANFCSNDSGLWIEGNASGGYGTYSFLWKNSSNDTLSETDSLWVTSAGTYTLEVADEASSETCPNEFLSVPVTVGILPTVQAGNDQTVCASEPTIYLNGSSSTGSGTWSGGTGIYNPGNNLVASYIPTASEIASGSITLYLTATNVDAGCEDVTDTLLITFSPTVEVSPSAMPIQCHDGTTVIYANASGGTAPYTYFWNTGSVNSSISISAGTYGITVHDQFGCIGQGNIFIPNPTPIVALLNSTNTSTDSSCDGSAIVSATGGTVPYSYTWNNFETTAATSATLCYGIYTVIIEDSNGCLMEGSVVVNKPSCSSFDVNASSTDVSCFGGSDGTVSASASGGTLPYSYSWNTVPPQSDATINGLNAGNYTVTVTDALGCIDVAGISVLQPLILTNNISYLNVSAIGASDGTATANPSGGTPAYTYLWEPTGQTTAAATGLSSAPGGVTYHVTITDANNCILEDSVIINEPPCSNFYLGVNLTHVTCYNSNNGSASLVIVDGTAPYDIHWSNGATSSSLSNLSAGNYSVSVTDSSNCTAIKTFTIGQPDPLSLSLVPTNVTCTNAGDGTIDLTVSGGTFPYMYTWYSGITPIADHEDLISLSPGTYSVSVNDVNGCSVTGSIGITQPATLLTSATHTNALCYGSATGTINATASGGILPYTYSWTGPGAFTSTSEDLSSLSAGLYRLSVTDANGCDRGPLDVYINQPTLLSVTTVLSNQVSCNGGEDGSVNTTASGGTLPYAYSWSGPGTFSSTLEDTNGLIAGTYTVSVTDANLCTTTSSVSVTTVTDITDPIVTCPNDTIVETALTTCLFTHTGSELNALASDNCQLNSLIYSLSGSTMGTGVSLSAVPLNTGATVVTWTATDASLNSASCSFTITVLDSVPPNVVSCGVIESTTVPTDLGYCSYSHSGTGWDPVATDNCSGTILAEYDITGATSLSGTNSLNAVEFNFGTSIVIWTLTDTFGNTSTCSFEVVVEDLQAPMVLSCGPLADTTVNTQSGECHFEVSGNSWNPEVVDLCTNSSITYVLSGATTDSGNTTLSGAILNTGTTNVLWVISDEDGNTVTCSYAVTVQDNEFPVLACSGTQSVDVDIAQCNYTKIGTGWDPIVSDNCGILSALADLSGATTMNQLETLSGVDFQQGTTTVLWTVTDVNGNSVTCSYTIEVTDNNIPSILTCGAGNQTVQNDANECFYTHSGTVWDATATDNCGTVSIVYSLSGATTGVGSSLSGVVFNLGSTQVLWTVTDGHGNTNTCSVNITVEDVQPPQVLNCPEQENLTFETDPGACTFTQNSTSLDPVVSDNCTIISAGCNLIGATTGTYTSLNGVVFNIGVTYVNWTFRDQSGNTATCSYSIEITDQEAPDFLSCPGNITVNTAPGECGRNVLWTAPIADDNCQYILSSNIEPGTFFSTGNTQVIYTATDASGNQSTCSFTVTVTDIEPPVFSCLPDISSCNPYITYPAPQASDNCGIASIYLKYGPASGSIFPIGTTQVTYEAIDIHGNSSLCTFAVVIHPTPTAYIAATDISCHGYANGIANLQVNGSAPFTFVWNTGQTSEDLMNLNSGVYSVTITDFFGCITSTQTTIQEPSAIVLSSSMKHVSCHDGNDGNIDLAVSGGAGGYSYYWSDGQNTQDADSVSSGNYTVVVTDSKGCAASLSATIYQPDTLWIDLTSVSAICSASNGIIYSQVTGGTPPYSYDWSNGQTGTVLSEVASGNYILTLTDANECVVQQIGNVGSENNLALTINTVDVSCNGLNDATARIIAEQAQAPYQIIWSNGDTGTSADSLSAGNYSVEFTDANGCSDTILVTISEPDSLNAWITTSSTIAGYEVSEHGSCDGWIEVVTDGGTADYTYLWSNGSTATYEDGLCSGEYGVVITDANGCTISRTISLSEPLLLEMPNGFSPNEDGDNDAFVVHGLDAYPDNEIVIFNRWGNIVYEKEGYQNDWKGENNQSEPLPDATYFIILKVNTSDGENVTLTGYIDLRRN